MEVDWDGQSVDESFSKSSGATLALSDFFFLASPYIDTYTTYV